MHTGYILGKQWVRSRIGHLGFAACCLVGLASCASAPGMVVGDSEMQAVLAEAKSTKPIPREVVAGSQVTASGQRVDLIDITPALVNNLAKERRAPEGVANAMLFHSKSSASPYLLGAGDALQINVWNQPEFNQDIKVTGVKEDMRPNGVFVLDSSGQIQLPFVGKLRVSGLTASQVHDQVTKRLGKYIISPQVTVNIVGYRSKKVYLDGELKLPGQQAIDDLPMSLSDAIGRAGGFTSFADRSNVLIVRQGKSRRIDMTALAKYGIDPNTLMLQNGDTVKVMRSEDSKVYVVGEVIKPTSMSMKNGTLSLSQALGESGGVNPTSGDPKQIYVLRAQEGVTQVYHLNASNLVSYALAENFPLQVNDVVYVDPVELVRWNRILNLVLPSATAITTVRSF